MRSVRFACAWIRDFALELWFAQRPEKRPAAVALADVPGDSAVIRQVSDRAVTAGIRPGITAAQAHALCADLQVIVLADIPVPSKSQQLLLHLQNLSPQVEARAPGLYLLGVSGLQRLYGSEANFAQTVMAAVRSHALPVSVGVADTAAAARIAALVSAPDTFTIIPPERARRFVAPLDIDLLEPSPRAAEQLKALGLRTITQVAGLPAGELVRRFGPEGARLCRLARGGEGRPFSPVALPKDRGREVAFSFALERVPEIVAHLERLAGELFSDLAARGGAAAALHVEMQLDHATSERLTLAVHRPTASALPFLAQLNERLKKLYFPSGVIGLSIALGDVAQAAAPQLELRRLERRSTTSKGGRSGPMPPTVDSVHIPRLVASHLPEESFALVASSAQPARYPAVPDTYRPAYASGPLTGLRLVSPPRRAIVTTHHGWPKTLLVESRVRNVRAQRGPWELSGRWWGVQFDRRYFEVETDGAERCLVFYDGTSTQWYLQGVFD